MLLSAALIREVHSCAVPSEDAIRAVTHATHTLCEWVSDTKVSEAVAAPVLTDALMRLREITQRAAAVQSTPITGPTMRDLRAAVDELRGFLLEDDYSDEEEEERGRNADAHRVPTAHSSEQSSEDTMLCREKAVLHMRVIFCVLVAIVALCTFGIYYLGLKQFDVYTEKVKSQTTLELLNVGISALEALYPSLLSAGVDVRFSGVGIASSVIEELSSTRTSSTRPQTPFFPPTASLFEFRAGTLDFTQQGRVVSINTIRTYGRLCEQNFTLPIRQLNDVMARMQYVLPVLTPNQCGNDAGTDGVFAGVTPPYQRYRPYFTTYRRNSARTANYYNAMFGVTIAVTYDHEILQRRCTPARTWFGLQNPLYSMYGNWLKQSAMWTALTMAIGLGVLFVLLELLSILRHPGWRVVLCVLVAGAVAAILAVVTVMLEYSLRDAIRNVYMSSNGELSRCVAAAMTSETLMKYNATDKFIELLYTRTLAGMIFYSVVGSNDVHPPEMKSAAEAVGALDFILFRRALHYDVVNGYVLYSMLQDDTQKQVVIVRKIPGRFAVSGSIPTIIGGGLGTLVFMLLYVNLSPLRRLMHYAKGSPFLLHHVRTHLMRYLLYFFIAAAVLGATIGLDMRASQGVTAGLTKLGSESMLVLAATNRAPSVAKVCKDSCGLPSFMVALYFKLVNSTAQYQSESSPYPFITGSQWESRYYGAQLSLSQLPTVIADLPAHYTPLVNETDKIITPQTLRRRVTVVADIDRKNGLAIERIPDSMHGEIFRFMCHSICTCISIALVLLCVCVLEWLYGCLHERRRQRRGLRGVYAAMVVMVLVVSVSMIVNVFVMRPLVFGIYHAFGQNELAMLAASVVTRLETVGLSGQSSGAPRDEQIIVNNLLAAIDDMTFSVRAGTYTYARWRLMQEYPSYGSKKLRPLSSTSDSTEDTIELGDTDQGLIPVCGTVTGSWVSTYLPGNKIYCYVELPLNTSRRLYAFVMREYALAVTGPAEKAWRDLLIPSILAACAVFLFLLVVLWWVLHSASTGDFAVIASEDVLTLTTPGLVPRHFTYVDTLIPRQQRLWWLLSVALLAAVLVYYANSLSNSLSVLRMVVLAAVPASSYARLSEMEVESVTDVYNFIIFAYQPSTLDYISLASSDVRTSQSGYDFLNTTNQGLFADTLDLLTTTLSAQVGLLAAYQQVDLIVTGYGSAATLVAARYADYINTQEEVLSLAFSMYSSVASFITAVTDIHYVNPVANTQGGKVISLLMEISTTRDYLRKLFVLDHVAISTYLVFNGLVNANTAWPFQSTISTVDMNVLMDNLVSASTSLVASIELHLTKVDNLSDDLFNGTSMLEVSNLNVRQLRAMYSTAYTLNDPGSNIWNYQKLRCVENAMKTDLTVAAARTEIETRLTKMVPDIQNALDVSVASEVTSRKSAQLLENIKRGIPLQYERQLMGWELENLVEETWKRSLTAISCTVGLYVFLLGACCVWYALKRRGILSVVASHDSAESEPLCAGGSGSSSDQRVSEPTRPLREKCLLLPLVIIALLAVVPMVCGFVMVWYGVNAAEQDLAGRDMGLRVASNQAAFEASCDAVISASAQSYATKDLSGLVEAISDLEDKADRLVNSYIWLIVHNNSGTVYVTPHLETFQELLASALSILDAEMKLNQRAIPVTKQLTFATELGWRAIELTEAITSTNEYSELIPMAATSTAGPVKALADQLYNDAFTAASAAPDIKSMVPTYESYRLAVEELDRVAQAELQTWHIIVAGSRKDGAKVALQYGNFEELVGTDALTPLGSSAAVGDITTYYTDILAATSDADALKTLFTTQVTPIPSSLGSTINTFKSAAAIAAYISDFEVEAMFLNQYAYNRMLIENSAGDPGATPLLTVMLNLVRASQDMVADGTLAFNFFSTKSQRNTWIWGMEIHASRTVGGPLMDLDYLTRATHWCMIVCFWIVFVAVAFAAWQTALL